MGVYLYKIIKLFFNYILLFLKNKNFTVKTSVIKSLQRKVK